MGTSLKGLDLNFKYDVAQSSGGENIKRCFACGVCTGGCLINEIGEEFDPRKIIRMVLFGMKKKVLSSPYIWSCLMCHNCSFHCPQDVRFSDVIGALRYIAIKEGYVHHSLVKKLALGVLLPSHIRLEIFSRPATLYQQLGLSYLFRKYRVLDRFPEKLGSLEYLLPQVPIRPLSRRLHTVTFPPGKREQIVGFFLNCADDLVFVKAGLSSVSVLTHNSCQVITPKDVKCCGMPSLAYGDVKRAKNLAKHNIDAFSKTGVEVIITDCATCGSFLKGYANLLKDDLEYAGRARDFSHKIQDISEFLNKSIKLKQDLKEVRGRVTYHESCHLLWGQQISKQPRQILTLIPGLEFVEMKEADNCCGGAGSYNLTHFETSMNILDRKMKNVAATGANLVASGCPGCRLQLRLGIKRQGLNASVVHPIELLDQAYGNS